jgi:hypothetical protein
LNHSRADTCEIPHDALLTHPVEANKMLTTRPEVRFMEKFAGLLAALSLTCIPVFAQAENHSPAVMALNIQHWRGTLVDASCATASNTKPADEGKAEQGTTVDSGRPQKAHAKSESSAPGCAVSSSTTAFALQEQGGHILRFDSVGNMRAAEALKNRSGWSKDLNGGKPIHAKVAGTMSGDTITVASLD